MKLTKSVAREFAQRLLESADAADQSHSDLVKWLSDALQDCAPEDCWCYLQDFVGDGESGMVYFCLDGDLTRAPYTISQTDGNISVQIDMDDCEDVMAVTTYKVEGDEMQAGAVTERDIPKSERDDMPDSDFAGKGKSFPIKKAEDVKAALSSIGRAGPGNYPADKLKANILRIARRKGFPIPKSDQEDSKEAASPKKAAQAMHDKAAKAGKKDAHAASMKLGADCPDDCPMGAKSEAARTQEAGARHSKSDMDMLQSIHEAAVKLGASCGDAMPAETNDNGVDANAATSEAEGVEITGDCIPLREGAVGQDGTAFLKLISPGWGSSGYYPAEVLQRDGPRVFTAGTKNFWDHQTATQEAERPEGSLRDFASVLTEDAHYESSGPAGPGLYAKAKVFEQFRQPVDDLAKHIGVSIRAMGKAKEGKAPDGKSGKIIEQLTHGISVDYVTTPGAGGAVLQLFEAARGRAAQPQPQPQEPEMAENNQQLTEALAEIRKLKERAAISGAAAGCVAAYLRTVQISEAIRERVSSRVLAGTIPVTESGDLDQAKVKQFAETHLNEELDFLRRLNPSLVQGMGPRPQSGQLTESQRLEAAERRKQEQEQIKESQVRFAELMGFDPEKQKQATRILAEGRRAFNPNYNARHHGAAMIAGGSSLGLEA